MAGGAAERRGSPGWPDEAAPLVARPARFVIHRSERSVGPAGAGGRQELPSPITSPQPAKNRWNRPRIGSPVTEFCDAWANGTLRFGNEAGGGAFFACQRDTVFEKRAAMKIIFISLLGLVTLLSRSAAGGEIHEAAGAGDVAIVKTLLAADPTRVDAKDDEDSTPLYLAIRQGHKAMVELLLANKADVNAHDSHGQTLLLLAAADGNQDGVAVLLAHKAKVNAKDKTGGTPLHSAATKEVAALLLAHGADVTAKTNRGATPLHAAAAMGRADVVGLLLANKADGNARDNDGKTPLHWAGTKAVAEFLLANKADVNAKDAAGQTPLQSALQRSRPDVAEWLRQHGGQ